MSTERMANGRSGDPDVAGDSDAERAATLDLDSVSAVEPSAAADDTWDPRLKAAAGMASAGAAAVMGAVALAVAAQAAGQPACVFPDELYAAEGGPRWVVVAVCLSAAAVALGAAGVWTGRRTGAVMHIAVGLAALTLAGAALAVTAGDVVTRPHIDGETYRGEYDQVTGMPQFDCR